MSICLEKDVINKLLVVAEGVNSVNSTIIFDDFLKSFEGNLIELKVQIDRWDKITVGFVFNKSIKSLVLNLLQSNSLQLWGADLMFSEFIPQNKILAFSYIEDIDFIDPKTVSLGILNSNQVNKLLNLKSFW